MWAVAGPIVILTRGLTLCRQVTLRRAVVVGVTVWSA